MDNGIALPLPAKMDPTTDWKTLSEDQFMKRYGNEVLKLYKLPTEEELANAMSDEGEGDGAYQADEE